MRLSGTIDRVLFSIRYPYVGPSAVFGLKYMSLPLFIKGAKDIKIEARSSSGVKKNITIQKNVWFGKDIEISTFKNSQVIIKSGTTIQDRSKIIGNVCIERGVTLAPNVFLSSGTHQAFYQPELTIREQDAIAPDASLENFNHIEEDCWIGVNVFIKHGTYIGRGAVVGANSVVLRDVNPYEVIIGNHKVLKKRIEFKPLSRANIKSQRPYFYRGFNSEGVIQSKKNLFIAPQPSKEFSLSLNGEGLECIKNIYSNFGLLHIHSAGPNSRWSISENSKDGFDLKKYKISIPKVLSNFLTLQFNIADNRRVKITDIELV